jgi:HPt (histidine-containing phosphotransfer) domain-containing protein
MDSMEIEIAKLQQEYISSFAEKEAELRALAANPATSADTFAKALHKIAGSGGTYRMDCLTLACRTLENAVLSGRFNVTHEPQALDAWFQFFAKARKSYEKLSASVAEDSYENWQKDLARVDTALITLWEKVAAHHESLKTDDEEAA